MPRYAAFLRAINLGKNRRVSGAQLCSLFEQMGFEEVATFRTSGNVVLSASRRPPVAAIEKALADALGYDVGVFLRSDREVLAVAEHEPFGAAAVEASKGKLQVALLGAKPTAAKRKAVLALATDEDRLAFGTRELYWLPSGGTQGSSLDWKAIGAQLGPTTVRTMGTIEQLVAKYLTRRRRQRHSRPLRGGGA